jgi:hypothetical protein
MLRYAPRFHGKKSPIFFLKSKNVMPYACNRGSGCEKLGGLGPLIENAQTVVKGLVKLLFRLQSNLHVLAN